ncbi:3D domain-containing protein [Bacillus sp. FJAT-47783]|uniref:3D domain-containing protein n=1 Tax=Bacillus sp. FJAT-47783 TaxID=2922712 RepID=UPI001FAC4226|nr:3D domain-containing protein [Bacillus sp. FJAT-47783]
MKKSLFTILTVAFLTGFSAQHIKAAERVVKKGDTLWNISQETNTTVENLMKWNQLTSTTIYPEQLLYVSPTKIVTIDEGDTLWSISKDYNVSIEDLLKWNDLESKAIFPGDKLVVQLNKDRPVENERKAEHKAQSKKDNLTNDQNIIKELSVEATAYTAYCKGCSGITATGVDLRANPNQKVIAVDPDVIPLGSKVYVEGYGYATAEDTGGAINGKRIDVFIPSLKEAKRFGRKTVKVKILGS